jgi:hypothetical protein
MQVIDELCDKHCNGGYYYEDANCYVCNLQQQAAKQAKELEALRKDGWRSCIDHIIKPEAECPVCKIEALQQQVARQQETILGVREVFHRFLRKTKQVRMELLSKETQARALQQQVDELRGALKLSMCPTCKNTGKIKDGVSLVGRDQDGSLQTERVWKDCPTCAIRQRLTAAQQENASE